MPYPFTPRISAADGAEIREAAGQLLAFAQQFQDNVAVEIKRGNATVLVVTPISVQLDNTQAAQGGSPVVITKRTGVMKLWSEEVTVGIQQSDRFVWNGLPCIVNAATEPHIDDLYVAVRFDIVSTNS
jgi:hypothetical protein